MKKILFALFACFISISSFADSKVLIDTTEDGTQYFGIIGSLNTGKDGWSLLISIKEPNKSVETRVLMGVTFVDCSNSVGTLNRFNKDTSSWTKVAFVTAHGDTIGDSIARAICEAGVSRAKQDQEQQKNKPKAPAKKEIIL